MNENKVLGISAKKGRWVFLPLSVIIMMCLGTVYSWSVFRIPLEGLFNIGATKSGLPYMFFLMFYAGLMPISGKLIDKYGPRTIMIFGGVVVGLGWILSGYAKDINMMAITYGIIAGGGVGIVYGAPLAVNSKWFPEKKGLIVGITLIGFGLSPLVTSPLARKSIEYLGILPAFKVLGVIFLVVIVLLSLPFKFPDQNTIISIQNNRNSHSEEIIGINTKQMFRSKKFYGLWLCFIIGTFSGLMMIGITSSVGHEIIHLDYMTTAQMVSIFAIFNGIGRPVFGWITDKSNPFIAVIISYGIIIFASFLMLTAKEGSFLIYMVSFSLFWFTLGGWLAIAPTATAKYFGLRHYSSNYGYVFTAYGVGAISGVLTSGIVRDVLGSYSFVFYPLMFLGMIGWLIALLMLRN